MYKTLIFNGIFFHIKWWTPDFSPSTVVQRVGASICIHAWCSKIRWHVHLSWQNCVSTTSKMKFIIDLPHHDMVHACLTRLFFLSEMEPPCMDYLQTLGQILWPHEHGERAWSNSPSLRRGGGHLAFRSWRSLTNQPRDVTSPQKNELWSLKMIYK